MTKVKVCGITNLSDALVAQKSKADALGFVFYAKSPRYIKPRAARKIILALNKSIKKVGVFVNPTRSYVRRILHLCRLDMLQFHGLESPAFCAKFKGYRVIKAFRLKDGINLKNINRYKKVAYYLFDTFKKGLPGGTGLSFKWSLIKRARLEKPFFVSGGLSPQNVGLVITSLRPAWVDASSSLEDYPGKKNHKRLEKFIEKVKTYKL